MEINGKEYRAINDGKALELAKQKVDLQKALADIEDLTIMVKERTLERDLAVAQKALVQQKADSYKADFERAQGDATRNYNLFIGERTLRQQASEFIPKGQSHGFTAKMLDFLNSQGFQVAWKIGQPAVQTFLTARCQR